MLSKLSSPRSAILNPASGDGSVVGGLARGYPCVLPLCNEDLLCAVRERSTVGPRPSRLGGSRWSMRSMLVRSESPFSSSETSGGSWARASVFARNATVRQYSSLLGDRQWPLYRSTRHWREDLAYALDPLDSRGLQACACPRLFCSPPPSLPSCRFLFRPIDRVQPTPAVPCPFNVPRLFRQPLRCRRPSRIIATLAAAGGHRQSTCHPRREKPKSKHGLRGNERDGRRGRRPIAVWRLWESNRHRRKTDGGPCHTLTGRARRSRRGPQPQGSAAAAETSRANEPSAPAVLFFGAAGPDSKCGCTRQQDPDSLPAQRRPGLKRCEAILGGEDDGAD